MYKEQCPRVFPMRSEKTARPNGTKHGESSEQRLRQRPLPYTAAERADGRFWAPQATRSPKEVQETPLDQLEPRQEMQRQPNGRPASHGDGDHDQ